MTSLRRDVHSAFEAITPPLGGMPERVVQTVLAERNGRLRKERMVFRLRVSLALVAAVLIAAVGVAAVMEWSSLHNNVSQAGVGLTSVQQLEARSLKLPTARSANACPDNAGTNTLGYQFGSGPVYVDGGPETATDWGYYYDVIYYASPNLRGPVLVRGRDLTTPDRPVIFVGPQAAGPVVGTDSAPNTGAQHTELVLDPSHPQFRGKANVGTSQIVYWHVRQGISKGWLGCVGFQIDGTSFTQIISALTPP